MREHWLPTLPLAAVVGLPEEEEVATGGPRRMLRRCCELPLCRALGLRNNKIKADRRQEHGEGN